MSGTPTRTASASAARNTRTARTSDGWSPVRWYSPKSSSASRASDTGRCSPSVWSRSVYDVGWLVPVEGEIQLDVVDLLHVGRACHDIKGVGDFFALPLIEDLPGRLRAHVVVDRQRDEPGAYREE